MFRHYFRILLVLFFVFSIFPNNVRAEESPIPEDEALNAAAKAYAKTYAVSVDEALGRLKRQPAIGDLQSHLSAIAPDAFAGLWIEHLPAYKIVVKTTTQGEEAIRSHIEETPLTDLIEVRSTATSLATLEMTQKSVMDTLRNLNFQVDSGINIQASVVELYILDRGQFDKALQEQNITLPDLVEVLVVEHLSKPASNLYGGLIPDGVCTFGFPVQHYQRKKGITIAAHCGNYPPTADTNFSYNGVTLPYENGVYSGNTDLQWHSASTHTVQPWFYNGSGTMLITGTRARLFQSVGNWVCKYGKETLAGCGTITTTSYQSSHVPASTATYIRVSQAGVNLSDPGDSGGPWFDGSVVLGTMVSHIPDNDAVYMAVDYFDNLALNIYTGDETYLPDLRDGSGWTSSITIRNDGSSGRRTKVIYLDSSGTYVANSLDICFINVNGFCTVEPPLNFTGSGVVDGSKDVSVVVEQKHGNQRSAYSGVQPNLQADRNWEAAGTNLHLPYSVIN